MGGGVCRRSRGEARCEAGCIRSPRTFACARSSADPRACCRSTMPHPRIHTSRSKRRCSSPCGLSHIPTSSSASRTAPGPEARYEQRESIELAFIAALQLLPPRQRAVLILRDVLGFSGAEVAEALDTTAASVYSALQRAHATLDERAPERSQQATLRSLGDEQLKEIVARYVEAWARNDVDTIVGMLTDTATLAMPPIPSWYRGREAIERVLRSAVFDGARSWRMLPTAANGQLAVGAYELDSSGVYAPHGVTVLTLEAERIDEIIHFRTPSMVESFGLPARA